MQMYSCTCHCIINAASFSRYMYKANPSTYKVACFFYLKEGDVFKVCILSQEYSIYTVLKKGVFFTVLKRGCFLCLRDHT